MNFLLPRAGFLRKACVRTKSNSINQKFQYVSNFLSISPQQFSGSWHLCRVALYSSYGLRTLDCAFKVFAAIADGAHFYPVHHWSTHYRAGLWFAKEKNKTNGTENVLPYHAQEMEYPSPLSLYQHLLGTAGSTDVLSYIYSKDIMISSQARSCNHPSYCCGWVFLVHCTHQC